MLGVMFDLDGTLVDSMSAWRELEGNLARRDGRELTPTEVDALTTMSIPECGAFIHEEFGLGSDAQDVVSIIGDFMMDFYTNRVELREGVNDFVSGLAVRDVPMALVSSTPQVLLETALHHVKLDEYIKVIVSVDLVGRSKRDPDVYDMACELIGTDRAQTWGFEDSIYAIRTLAQAGYRTCGIYDCDISATYEVLCAEADIAVRSFVDLSAESFLERANKWEETH